MKLTIPYALGIFCAAFLFMLYSAPAEAFSKDQVDRYSFAKSEEGIAVYTLAFALGGFSKDTYIPVVGERDLANGARKDRFGYVINSGYPNEISTDGEVTSFLIASHEIVDGHYKIPAGTTGLFKIIALLNIDESESNTYQFSVTELPFFVGDKKEARSFNPSELKYMNSTFEALRFERDPE